MDVDNPDDDDVMDIEPINRDLAVRSSSAQPDTTTRRRCPTSRQDDVIDPQLLADQRGGELLRASMSDSSAGVLVSSEVITSAYRLPEPIYGIVPAIPAVDYTLLQQPKATSSSGMSAQIDRLTVALAASFEREKQLRTTHDAMAAQLSLAGMYANKVQHQLANSENRKKKPKGNQIHSNGFARIVTDRTLIAEEKEREGNKVAEAAALIRKAELKAEWTEFRDEQTRVWGAWRAEKKRCAEAGVVFAMNKPNPVLKKTEWVYLYEGEIDDLEDEDEE